MRNALRNSVRNFLVLVLCMIGSALAARSAQAQGGTGGPPPAPVRVVEVREETLQARQMVTGDLRAARRSQVATREAGLVAKLHVEEGMRVKTGDLLAELDSGLLEIELRAIEGETAEAAAIVAERNAELEQLERDLKLLQQSFERNAANPKELYDAEASVAIINARLAQATQRVETTGARADFLRRRVEDMQIRAPFDGAVVAKHADLGEWLGEGDAVVELVSADPIEAWLNLPQNLRAAAAREGLEIAVRVDATSDVIQTRALRTIALVDPRARTFTLIATLPNRDMLFAPGMSVTAWVPTESMSAQLVVPKNAVLRSDTGAFVYAARALGADQPPAAVMVRVTERFPLGADVVVQSPDLKSGDLVVVEGNERLFPMAPLQPIHEPAASGTSGAGATAEAEGNS